MKSKRIFAVLLIFALIFGCTVEPASAVDIPDDGSVQPRASGTIAHTISGNTIVGIGDWFYTSSGETVTYNCRYSPKSASMDFGLVDPSGTFYKINCTNGSINIAIEISVSGQYRLVIRNNESYDVTVTGSVTY